MEGSLGLWDETLSQTNETETLWAWHCLPYLSATFTKVSLWQFLVQPAVLSVTRFDERSTT